MAAFQWNSKNSVSWIIGTRIILTTALIVFVLLALGLFFYNKNAYDERFEDSRQSFNSYYRIIKSMIITQNYDGIYSVSNIMADIPEIIQINITDIDGSQIVDFKRPAKVGTKTFQFGNDVTDRANRGIGSGKVNVEYAVYPDFFPKNYFSSPAVVFSILIFFAFAGLALIIYLSLIKEIANPIKELHEEITGMKKPRPHIFKSIGAKELRELSDALTNMNNRLVGHANYDALTNLFNRRRIIEFITEATETKQPFRVFYIDIDNFKYVNDQFGHTTGDKLIHQFAEGLKCIESENVICGRLGGDEFIVIEFNYNPSGGDLASDIINSAKMRFSDNNLDISITCCAGSAVYPKDGIDAHTLISHADIALLEAKKIFPATHKAYSARQMKTHIIRQNAITRLRDMTNQGIVRHAFQPIVSTETNLVIGFESLLRVHDENDNLISPDIVVEASQQLGNIAMLTEFTILNACAFVKKYDTSERPYFVTINLNREQILSPNLIFKLLKALEIFEIKKSQLVIEVTEESIQSDRRMIQKLSELTENGFTLALDDFGRGYSSLYCLIYLPFKYMKIDRSLTSSIVYDERALKLLQSIINIATNLNMGVVAEGIETKEMFHYIRDAGCACGQGYYLGRPLLPKIATTHDVQVLNSLRQENSASEESLI